jgi:hypothetical protein
MVGHAGSSPAVTLLWILAPLAVIGLMLWWTYIVERHLAEGRDNRLRQPTPPSQTASPERTAIQGEPY